MFRIYIVGTSHDNFQTRSVDGLQEGSDAFSAFLAEVVENYEIATIAEEMSVEALGGRSSVPAEVARNHYTKHIFCDPDTVERKELGIGGCWSLREKEWLRRIGGAARCPILFVCGADHVESFRHLCCSSRYLVKIVERDFCIPLPFDKRII